MRRMVRWKLLLPAAALVTVLGPSLRSMPGGEFFPDPWLLLLLWAVPEPPPWSWKGPIQLVVLLGAFRAAVSAVSPFEGWAGFAMALLVRRLLFSRLTQRRISARFLIGAAAALPLAIFDLRAALGLGLPADVMTQVIRVGFVGFLWSTALGPGPYPDALPEPRPAT